jgi:hypothetical protein
MGWKFQNPIALKPWIQKLQAMELQSISTPSKSFKKSTCIAILNNMPKTQKPFLATEELKGLKGLLF